MKKGIFSGGKARKSSKDVFYRHKFGGFRVELCFNELNVRRCYAEVSTQSEIYAIRIGAGMQAYPFLMQCALSGDWSSVEAWVFAHYSVCCYLSEDEGFATGVCDAISELAGKLMDKAEGEMLRVTELEEESSEALMRDAVEYADIDDAERERRKETMREDFGKVMEGLRAEADMAEGKEG